MPALKHRLGNSQARIKKSWIFQ